MNKIKILIPIDSPDYFTQIQNEKKNEIIEIDKNGPKCDSKNTFQINRKNTFTQ